MSADPPYTREGLAARAPGGRTRVRWPDVDTGEGGLDRVSWFATHRARAAAD